jgi:2-hydroxychromene-2-carboxylate isomerase
LALQAYSRRDAALIAPFHNLSFTDAGQQPSEASLKLARRSLAASSNLPKAAAEIGEAFWSDDTDKLDRTAMVSDDQTERVFREGTRLRGQLGHYLGATFFFEGEWYWGLDRLPYLEERLAEAGLRLSGCRQITAFQTRPEFMGSPSNGKRLTVEFYPSARSPYTAIAMKETLDLPNHYPVNVHVRPVLPMVMRNLPVPPKKRFYILRDTKREADRIGAPFGKIADPVGEPVRRVYSLFSWAEEQGKGGALLQAFVDMAWAEGIETGSDNGMKQVCARAGLDWEVASTIIDNKDWEGWAEDNRLQMLKSDLWGVPSFRLVDESGTELYAGWGRDRIWLLAHEIQKALAS